jgi:hypothetical protein
VVSLIAPGRSRDDRGRLYPRRRNQPWVILVALLALGGIVVWILAMSKSDTDTGSMTCSNPTAGASGAPAQPAQAPLGQRQARNALGNVEPAALPGTQVRVYNANDQRGQAAQVASQLSDLGFSSPPDVQVGNDPVYVNQDMQCFSQIRFGPAGRSAAASVQLFAPCSELIMDNRADATVDLALGTLYSTDTSPNANAQEVLAALKDVAPGVKPQPQDPSLLAAARKATC